MCVFGAVAELRGERLKTCCAPSPAGRPASLSPLSCYLARAAPPLLSRRLLPSSRPSRGKSFQAQTPLAACWPEGLVGMTSWMGGAVSKASQPGHGDFAGEAPGLRLPALGRRSCVLGLLHSSVSAGSSWAHLFQLGAELGFGGCEELCVEERRQRRIN